MAYRSEFQTWRDELEPPPKLTIPERLARWFNRAAPPADHFVWRNLDEHFPVEIEDV